VYNHDVLYNMCKGNCHEIFDPRFARRRFDSSEIFGKSEIRIPVGGNDPSQTISSDP
jgi:hypothetical protein